LPQFEHILFDYFSYSFSEPPYCWRFSRIDDAKKKKVKKENLMRIDNVIFFCSPNQRKKKRKKNQKSNIIHFFLLIYLPIHIQQMALQQRLLKGQL
jgi:hypothetical protein